MKPGSKISTTLVVSVAVVGAVCVSAPALLFAGETMHIVSPQLRHSLKEARDDLATQKYAEAISKLKEVEAIQSRAPYDQHVINELLAYAYMKTRDYADAAKDSLAGLQDSEWRTALERLADFTVSRAA